MNDEQNVATCRWARQTLYLPYPMWLNAEDQPWTCLRDAEPRPLDDTDICRDCPRWEPRRLHVQELRGS
jgi:hypothetical protein